MARLIMDVMNRLPQRVTLMTWLLRFREGLRQVGQGLAMPTTGS